MMLKEKMIKDGESLFRWRSYLPLLLGSIFLVAMYRYRLPGGDETTDKLWEGVCLLVSSLGVLVRVLTAGHAPRRTSGRNTRKQVAERLNTTGMYSITRHPLYLGNYLIMLGVSLFPFQWWLPVICSLAFWIYYERIMMAEEEFLSKKFGAAYSKWAEETPAFIPAIWKWRPGELPFSLRTVLKREYNSVFAIIVAFAALEFIGNAIAYEELVLDIAWCALLVASFLAWTTLRFAKKHTSLLKVPER